MRVLSQSPPVSTGDAHPSHRFMVVTSYVLSSLLLPLPWCIVVLLYRHCPAIITIITARRRRHRRWYTDARLAGWTQPRFGRIVSVRSRRLKKVSLSDYEPLCSPMTPVCHWKDNELKIIWVLMQSRFLVFDKFTSTPAAESVLRRPPARKPDRQVRQPSTVPTVWLSWYALASTSYLWQKHKKIIKRYAFKKPTQTENF